MTHVALRSYLRRLGWVACCLVLVSPVRFGQRASASAADRIADFRGALLPLGDVEAERLCAERARGTNAIVLSLEENSAESRADVARAAERIRAAGLGLYYWIEVGRCPSLADAHPEWMASLQGHDQWRRFFPDLRQPHADEVVKVYPWVPILYREAYAAQLQRVSELLQARPAADGLFLNDLQGAPSACGCGSPLCRWTADYGPIQTATPAGDDAAARFVQAVGERFPGIPVVPVWVTECEEHDGSPEGLCAGVGCFRGICWKAYTRQLMPVAKQAATIAVLAPYREFQRDLPRYGDAGSWVREALRSFQTMPPLHQGESVEPSRLLAVLQGWGTPDEALAVQRTLVAESGAAGYLVAFQRIEQDWQPQILRWKED